MPFTGPMEDRLAIRDLYDTYADAANRGDRTLWLGCFTGDANWWTHYFDVTGRDAIGTQYDQTMAAVEKAIFMTQICAIEVSGDSAHCRAVCSERLFMGAAGEMQLTGMYHDELARVDGQWLFAKRVYKVVTEVMLP